MQAGYFFFLKQIYTVTAYILLKNLIRLYMNISFVFKFKHYPLFLGLLPTEEMVIFDSLVSIMEKSGDFF